MDKLKENGCESYKERCGEIFLTFLGNLNIHCTLCETVYKSYEAYATHIYEDHFKNLEHKNSENVKPDFINEGTKEITSLLNIEMESSENEILKEEEFPIDSLLHNGNISENDSSDSTDLYEKTQWSETSLPISTRKSRSSAKCKKTTNNINNERKFCRNKGLKYVNKQNREIGAKSEPNEVSCKCQYACTGVTLECRKKIFHDFWNLGNYNEQQIYLKNRIRLCLINRRRHGNYDDAIKSRRQNTFKYYLLIDGISEVQVCKKTFCETFDISQRRVQNLSEKIARNDESVKDGRGKKRQRREPQWKEKIIDTCERKFLCSYCGLSFAANSHLKRHVRTHTNQRDYKCEICGKAFFRSYTLKGHMMGHSSERPFACETCPAKFSRKKALQTHIKLHENKLE